VSDPTTRTGTGERAPLSEQATLGLLPYLTAHALDEDYAHAAARRATGAEPPGRRRVGTAGALAIAVFALLAVTAAVQTSQDSVSQERERRALIDQVKARKAALVADRKTVARLQADNSRLQSEVFRAHASADAVLREVRLLSLRSGTTAVHGPGVEIVVDDARNAASDRNKVLDKDLQTLVNGLWAAGAEAISINRERLTGLSPIRHAGSAITVNFDRLSPPYRILAIGDPKSLQSRFVDSTSGQTWFDVQRQFGLRFSMHTQGSLRLPAAEVPDLRLASTIGSPAGKGLS
jgi:uncharacterized protein YlxW (UPF0749 family)